MLTSLKFPAWVNPRTIIQVIEDIDDLDFDFCKGDLKAEVTEVTGKDRKFFDYQVMVEEIDGCGYFGFHGKFKQEPEPEEMSQKERELLRAMNALDREAREFYITNYYIDWRFGNIAGNVVISGNDNQGNYGVYETLSW